MSQTIDERVVKMEFDNSNFDDRIEASQRALNKFNDYINKSSSESVAGANAFTELGEAALRNVASFTGLNDAVSMIANTFGSFNIAGEIVRTTVGNITNSITSSMGSIVNYVTMLDQIGVGWGKYNDKTASVQTIMSATGKSIDEVTASLEKLNWFTDETSYNYIDMVNNIGKFTSAGVDLDDAVNAMMGIANEAAVSGQGVNEASRAMYNFAQAMGVGSVKLMDWKSIENANMATVEFKQTILDTAEALGTIKKTASGAYYALAGGDEFDVASFSNELSQGWFTSDVLIQSLKKYSDFADAIYEISDAYDTASEAIAHTSTEGMELGAKAFKAAQEAKTFEEAIASVNDAVSTGWMTTFELVFGNYEEAKVLWTDLANELWEVFAAGGVERNETLGEALTTPVKKLQDAFAEIGMDANTYADFISNTMVEAGVPLKYLIEEYGSLDEVIRNGYLHIDDLTSSISDLYIETVNSAYGVDTASQRFEYFKMLVMESAKDTGRSIEMYQQLAKAGFSFSNQIEVIDKVLSGEATSWNDLKLSQEEYNKVMNDTQKACEQYVIDNYNLLDSNSSVNKSFDAFKETVLSSTKGLVGQVDIYGALERAGISYSDGMILINEINSESGRTFEELSENEQYLVTQAQAVTKILNGEVESFSDLTEAEKEVLFFTDEYSNGLRELYFELNDTESGIRAVFEALGDLGGRELLIDGLKTILSGMIAVLDAVKEGFREVFPPITGDRCYELIKAFNEFVHSLEWSEETSESFKSTIAGLAAVFDIVLRVISDLLIPVKALFGITDDVGGGVLKITGNIGDLLVAVDKWIADNDFLKLGMQAIATVITKVIDAISDLITYVTSIDISFSSLSKLVLDPLALILNGILDFIEDVTGLDLTIVKNIFYDIYEFLSGAFNNLDAITSDTFGGIIGWFERLYDSLSKGTIIEDIAAGFDHLKDSLKEFADKIFAPIKEAGASYDSISQSSLNLFDMLADAIVNFSEKITGSNLENARTLLHDAFRTIGDVIDGICGWINKALPALQSGLATFFDYVAFSFQQFDWNMFTDRLTYLKDGIVNFFERVVNVVKTGDWRTNFPALASIYDALVAFKNVTVDSFVAVFETLKNALTSIVDWLSENFKDASPADLAVIGFSFALIYLLMKLGQLAGACTKLIGGIGELGDNLKNVFKNLGNAIREFGKGGDLSAKFLKFAIAMGVITGVFIYLTQIGEDGKLWESFGVIAGITALFAALEWWLMKVNNSKIQPKFVEKTQTNFASIGILMIGIASAILLIVQAIININNAGSLTDLATPIAIVSGIILVVMGMAALCDHIIKNSSKFIQAIGVALVVFTLAYSVEAIVETLKGLVGITEDADAIQQAAISLAIVFASIGALAIVAKGVDLKSAIGMIAILYSIQMISDAVESLQGSIIDPTQLDKLSEKVIGIIGVMMLFAVLIAALARGKTEGVITSSGLFKSTSSFDGIASTGADMSKIGLGIALMMASIGVLAKALEMLNATLSKPNIRWKPIMLTLAGFAVFCATMAVLSQYTADSRMTSFGIGMIAMSGALYVVALAMGQIAQIARYNPKSMVVAIAAIAVLGTIAVALVAVSDHTKNCKVGAIVAMIGALAIVMSGLGILSALAASNPWGLLEAAVVLDATLLSLAAALRRASSMRIKKGPLITFAGILLILVGSLVVLTTIKDTTTMVTAALCITMVMAALALAIETIAKSGSKITKASKALVPLGACLLMIGACIAVLAFTTMYDVFAMVGSLAAVGVIMKVLTIILEDISKIDKNVNTASKALMPLATCIGLLAICLAGLAFVAHFDPFAMLEALGAITLLMIALGLTIKMIGEAGKDVNKATSVFKPLIATAASLSLLMLILTPLAHFAPVGMAVAVAAIGGIMYAMAQTIKVIAGIKGDTTKAIAALQPLSTAIFILSICLAGLSAVAYYAPGGMIVAVVALSTLMLALAGAIKIISDSGKNAEKAITALTPMIAAVGSLALILAIMSVVAEYNLSGTAVAFGALTLLMLALAKTLEIISGIDKNVNTAVKALQPLSTAIFILSLCLAGLAVIANLNPTAMLIAAVSLAGIMYAMTKAIASIAELDKNVNTAVKALQPLAICIAILSGCLGGLALIANLNPNSMLVAVGALALIMLSLVGTLQEVSKVGSTADKATNALIKMAAAISIVSGCLAILAMVPADRSLITTAISMGIAILATALALTIIAEKGSAKTDKAATTMLKMSGCLAIATACLAILSKINMDPKQTIGNAIGLAGCILACALALKIASESGKDAGKAAGAMGLMSGALLLCAGSLAALSKFSNADTLFQNAIALAGIMLALSVVLLIAANAGENAVKGAAAMAIISAAVAIVAGSLYALASLGENSKNLIAGAVALAIVMVICAFACMIADEGVKGAVAMLAMGAACVLLATSLSSLASLNPEGLWQAVGAIAAIVVVLAIVGFIAKFAAEGIIVITAAIVGIAAAILIISMAAINFGVAAMMIVGAMALLQALDMSAVTANLTALAGAIPDALAAFGEGLVENIESIKETILTLGETVLEVIGELIPEAVETLWTLIDKFFATMEEHLPSITDNIMSTFLQFMTQMSTYIPRITEQFMNMLLGIMTEMHEYVPQIVDEFQKMIIDILNVMGENIGPTVEAAATFIANFLNALADNLPDIIDAGTNLICALIQGIADSSVDIIDAAFQAITTFIDGLATAIDENHEDFEKAVSHLFESALTAVTSFLNGDGMNKLKEAARTVLEGMKATIKDRIDSIKESVKEKFNGILEYLRGLWEDLKTIGEFIFDGLKEGLSVSWENIKSFFDDAWDWIVTTVKTAFGIASPSKLFRKFGGWMMEGLGLGVEDETEYAVSTMEGACEQLIDPMAQALQQANDLVSDISANPTITPVVDLSDVESSASRISGLFDQQQLNFSNVNFGGYASLQASRVGRNDDSNIQNGGGNQVNNVTYTFNQTNNSPKALSRIDIYRQTRNQFSQLAGAGGLR